MTTTTLLLIVVAIVVVLAVILATGLIVARRRRINLRGRSTETLERPKTGGYQAGGGITLAPGGQQLEAPERPTAEPTKPAETIEPAERAEGDGQPGGGAATLPAEEKPRPAEPVVKQVEPLSRRKKRGGAGLQRCAGGRQQEHRRGTRDQRAHAGSSSAAAMSRQSNAATPRSRCEA